MGCLVSGSRRQCRETKKYNKGTQATVKNLTKGKEDKNGSNGRTPVWERSHRGPTQTPCCDRATRSLHRPREERLLGGSTGFFFFFTGRCAGCGDQEEASQPGAIRPLGSHTEHDERSAFALSDGGFIITVTFPEVSPSPRLLSVSGKTRLPDSQATDPDEWICTNGFFFFLTCTTLCMSSLVHVRTDNEKTFVDDFDVELNIFMRFVSRLKRPLF